MTDRKHIYTQDEHAETMAMREVLIALVEQTDDDDIAKLMRERKLTAAAKEPFSLIAHSDGRVESGSAELTGMRYVVLDAESDDPVAIVGTHEIPLSNTAHIRALSENLMEMADGELKKKFEAIAMHLVGQTRRESAPA